MEYLEKRKEMLENTAARYHEALFPFISRDGSMDFWPPGVWGKPKAHVELAAGVRLRWQDFRPTLAQICKDAGAPIEAISKVLRDTSSKTTERYCARIRPESAFSQVKTAWQAWKPLQSENHKVQNQKSASRTKVG